MQPVDPALPQRDDALPPDAPAAPASSDANGPRAPGLALRWQRRYAAGLLLTDALSLIWVVFGTQIAWLPADATIPAGTVPVSIQYTFASVSLILLWLAALTLNESRGFRVTGVGFEEYRRVIEASFLLFAWIAIFAYLLQWHIARGYLLIALPAGIAVLVLTRWLWRHWLGAKRDRGAFTQRVLLVGSEPSAAHVAAELARSPRAGYRVVAACVPGRTPAAQLPGTDVPVVGGLDDVTSAAERCSADTLIITSSDHLPPDRVRQISWSLEQGRRHLVMAPSLADVAGPRIRTRPVAGLPLIHVETPYLSSGQRLLKRGTDIALSAVGLILLSPLLVVIALIVRLTSPGPALFAQERIGRRGEPFAMLKFRTMRNGAEKDLAALLQERGTATTPLFKVRDDPRVTPIGRWLRRYSLDELPQLFNVLMGTMSLVGPRPQIAAEVALYSDAHRRRLLVRPGITGLWQVSGRSSIAWEQAVQLDLYYVENWSLMGDFLILFKTAKAVLSPGDTAF